MQCLLACIAPQRGPHVAALYDACLQWHKIKLNMYTRWRMGQNIIEKKMSIFYETFYQTWLGIYWLYD